MRSVPPPFDPETFRTEGHKLIDLLSDYLRDALSGSEMPVLPVKEPEELAKYFAFSASADDSEPLTEFMKRVIDNSNHLHHPRYIGHQVTSPLPVTVLAQLCTTLLNNGAAIYEMGQASMAMEKNVVNRIGSLIGYAHGYDGIFTHGGTAGNLTAMLAARQAMASYNIWEEGVKDDCRPGYMVSEQSHYSIARNVKIMGLGNDSVIRVPHDGKFRMNTTMLAECMEKAAGRGIRPVCVVANACSTATGSYDDLEAIASFCEKHSLWLHVDGAHGMGVIFSKKLRDKVKGIERADSVVIDFHKMLLVPALNTLVMFRDGSKSYETFAQKASYLFSKSEENVWYNSAIRTIECTKSSLGVIAYTAVKYYGDKYLAEYVESRYDLTSKFAALIRSKPGFELATDPESNIICFRKADTGMNPEEQNKLNSAIREEIVRSGRFYIVKAVIAGKVFLRLTVINPLTSAEDLEMLLSEIETIARNRK